MKIEIEDQIRNSEMEIKIQKSEIEMKIKIYGN